VVVPEGAMAETVDRLYRANVRIEAREQARGPTLGDILLGLLPMLLLIGAWFFFLRQMQRSAGNSQRPPD
jgi:cell division protease FtsH